MNVRQCAVVICFLAGAVAVLYSQQTKPQTQDQAAQAELHIFVSPCPEGSYCVDLCLLAAQLDRPDPTDAATGVLEAPKGHPHRVHAHDDIRLSYDKKEQIIWTCKNKGFQITQIQRVWDGCDDRSIPDMPFDLKRYAFDPTTGYSYLRAPQNPGAQLYSGPPVGGAVGHTYKFSFIIASDTPPGVRGSKSPDPPVLWAGKLYDPHIIVTGPGDPTGRKSCISPGPHPTPSPHKKEK